MESFPKIIHWMFQSQIMQVSVLELQESVVFGTGDKPLLYMYGVSHTWNRDMILEEPQDP